MPSSFHGGHLWAQSSGICARVKNIQLSMPGLMGLVCLVCNVCYYSGLSALLLLSMSVVESATAASRGAVAVQLLEVEACVVAALAGVDPALERAINKDVG